MGGFVKKAIKSAANPVYGLKQVAGAVGDAITPDINMPDTEMLEEEIVDPQEAVTEAAQKKRARIKKQQEQSTLLTGATTTGGTSSLLG